jgi:hypothetical protein
LLERPAQCGELRNFGLGELRSAGGQFLDVQLEVSGGLLRHVITERKRAKPSALRDERDCRAGGIQNRLRVWIGT